MGVNCFSADPPPPPLRIKVFIFGEPHIPKRVVLFYWHFGWCLKILFFLSEMVSFQWFKPDFINSQGKYMFLLIKGNSVCLQVGGNQ
jgi:hypothetical protein